MRYPSSDFWRVLSARDLCFLLNTEILWYIPVQLLRCKRNIAASPNSVPREPRIQCERVGFVVSRSPLIDNLVRSLPNPESHMTP